MSDIDGITKLRSLSHPEGLQCRLWRYNKGLSELDIRVYAGSDGSEPFMLSFSDVQYISGPTIWRSARFSLGTSDQMKQCLAHHFQQPASMLVDAGAWTMFVIGPTVVIAAHQLNWQLHPM